jgi:small subunit ribosomal protein S2
MNRIEKLFKAGVHFGHKTQYWSPKMAPFIWGKKDGIHLINVALTDIQLSKAEQLVESIAANGGPILWVGTKKVARNVVVKYATESQSPFFANRWVGGTLTNYHEVKKTVKKMLINEEIYTKSNQTENSGKAIYTKKELNLLQKKVERSKKIISGIEKLSYPVGALIVTDIKKDQVAVKEAIKMGIPVIGFVDTNANPQGISLIIPTNDDLEGALDIICSYLAEAIKKGKETFAKNNAIELEKLAEAKKQEKNERNERHEHNESGKEKKEFKTPQRSQKATPKGESQNTTSKETKELESVNTESLSPQGTKENNNEIKKQTNSTKTSHFNKNTKKNK